MGDPSMIKLKSLYSPLNSVVLQYFAGPKTRDKYLAIFSVVPYLLS
jgi:hypothetical protein